MTRRILHVIGGMERGGIQSWLMHLLHAIDRRRYRMDFLISTEQPCAFDQEIVELGGSLLRCRSARRPWQYAQDFARALSTQAPYDVIHSHVYAFTGFVLRLAARQRVPLRIAHCHNDRRIVEARGGLLRQGQLRLLKSWIHKYAGVKVAASADAAADLFGPGWAGDPSVRVVHCGIDLTPFRSVPDPSLRARLGLPPDALVLGHVGRFVAQKNQAFLIDLAAEAIKLDPRVHLLLVGAGPLRREIERRAAQAGLAGRVVFAGERGDVPAIMAAAMDAFAFPSLHEGLGLVLIEAQAAGLPCLIADVVPREAEVVSGQVHRLALGQGPAAWARRLLEIVAAPRPEPAGALAAVAASTFNINRSVQEMARIYDRDG